MTTPLVRIVDDDADARSSSSFFLSMMGLEIKEYESAQRFLDEDDMNRRDASSWMYACRT